MLKVAVVGCGKIADGHVEEIRKVPGASVVAVCDLEPLMAEQIAVRYGVPRWYSDFDRLLDEQQPDVVHITTPPQSHLGLGIKAADAGCHLYMEKPLAMNSEEARRLITHATAAGRKMTINYWPNFDPPGLLLDEMVKSGAIGELVHVESWLGYDLSGAYGEALLSDASHWVHRLPGKLFHNTLDHILAKIVRLLPEDAPTVMAHGYRRRPATGNPVADSVFDELRFTLAGATVTASGVFSASAKPTAHFLRVYGTRSTIHVDFNSRLVVADPDVRYPSALGRLEPGFTQAGRYRRAAWQNVRQFARSEFSYFAGMRELIRRFYASITEGAELPVPYEQMQRISSLMDSVFALVPQQNAGQP